MNGNPLVSTSTSSFLQTTDLIAMYLPSLSSYSARHRFHHVTLTEHTAIGNGAEVEEDVCLHRRRSVWWIRNCADSELTKFHCHESGWEATDCWTLTSVMLESISTITFLSTICMTCKEKMWSTTASVSNVRPQGGILGMHYNIAFTMHAL